MLQPLNQNSEAQLLLACINVSTSPEEKSARIDILLQQTIDWDRFTLLVMTHGLASFVCPVLKPKVGPDGVPFHTFAGLRYWELANVANAQRNAEELAALMSHFDAAGIPALVFKGPALAVAAYGNPAIRNYSDLDILVSRARVVTSAEILIANGYNVHSFNREVFESGFFHNKSNNFYSERASVDLHWILQDPWFPFSPDEEALWSHTETFVLNGREFRTLGAANHLLFICVHAAKHGWPTLASIVDIAAFLTACPEVDLVALIDEATRLRSRRMLLLGFSLAHQLAGAPLKNQVWRIIDGDHAVCKLTEQISARLLTQLQYQSVVDRWISAASTLESRSEQLRMFALHILNPIADDYVRFPLPPAFYPLYYILRPLRLAANLAMGLLHQAVAASEFRDAI